MIHIVDYGTGNVGSVLNMIRKVGGEARASGDAEELLKATKLLLPGVGSFDNAVQKLGKLGLPDLLRDKVREGVPLLGICLGMQLLSDGSEEGVLPGLGLIPGRVRRFSFGPECADLKIPHMGWNRIRRRKAHPLLDGLDEKSRFYFVHSYHYQCQDEADVLLETPYGYDFTSGVQRGNVMGVQFHPEKSHRYGMQLMKNFVGI
mgnify:CR=1 FL=1|jgi:glutamine amidotransferase